MLGFLYFFWKIDADLTLYLCDYFSDVKKSLRGKTVWITGSSSGIGEYLAYELARHGCKLILSGINEERLNSVKFKCIEIGLVEDDVYVLPFNLTDFDIHEECVKKVLQKFRKLDILINNAGRSQRASFEEIDIKVDKEIFDINLFGTLNLTRKILPHFIENKGGHFVVTSSCVGKMGIPSSASYTGSKHALHGYFETLRVEMSRKNIDVTMLCPGPVFSHALENAFTGTPGQKFGRLSKSTDRKMQTDRCARLMSVAIAHKLDEVWIAPQPNLVFFYLVQYTPTFFRKDRLSLCFRGKVLDSPFIAYGDLVEEAVMMVSQRLSSTTTPEVINALLTSQMRRLFNLVGRNAAESDRSTFFGSTGPGFETTLAACYQGYQLSPPPRGRKIFPDLSEKTSYAEVSFQKRQCCSHAWGPTPENVPGPAAFL
ncbi:hypothetical protein NPIL_531261 [Nephila pilipes]|uniref:Dehydrogenase/reductase SDR family member 7 n=1 Tax=Nephila pilipes TaxID=299642 RepID=A0A8X6THH5_NEPPI|nr:hypothetical protein NPIL_531261 [Nephila pilipes]